MPRELFSVVCDDIRIEEGNKASLMGIYSEGLIVPKIPFLMPRLCLFQELDAVEKIKNFRVELRGPKVNIKAALRPSKEPQQKISLRVMFGPVEFEEEGDYRFDTYLDESSDPIATKRFFVKLREDLKIS